MAGERRRRRRGRRRGGGDGHPSDRPTEERPEEGQTEGAEEGEPQSTEESGSPSRRRFFFGRRRDREEEAEEKAERRREEHEERQAAGTPAHVSPLSFWRRGRARTYREQPMPKQTLGRTLRRVRGLQFPPWAPVMLIIFVVFGILAFLLVGPLSSAAAPRIGQDHWHATYQTFICGQRQSNFPFWQAGVHTHDDGVIHIHPNLPQEQGAGARLAKWFEYGGGKLTQTELKKPGSREEFKNGDLCEDGREGFVQVFVNGEKQDDWRRYIPQDGDRVRIEFGPERSAPMELDDRTVIEETEAARTVELEVTGAEGDAAFVPDSIQLEPGETVKLNVKNFSSLSRIVRVSGPDGEYGTSDDFVSEPEVIEPGQEGFVIVRFDEEGEFAFQDPSDPSAAGTIVVTEELAEETPEPGDAEPVDVTFDVSMGDNFFEPSELELEAGQTFRINLTNDGELIHNLRISGLDGTFDTRDDLVSTPKFQTGGETGELVGQIDEPGVYDFRDDSHQTEAVGKLTVK